METVTAVAQVALALTFLVAGIAKAMAPAALVPMATALRVPAVLRRPFAYGVAMLESATGTLLLFGAAAGVAGALVLCLAFLGVAVMNAVRDEPIPCGCFGYHREGPANPGRTLVRLAWLFGAIALLGLFGPQSVNLVETLAGLGVLLIGTWLLLLQEALALRDLQSVGAVPPRRFSYRELPLDTIPRSPQPDRLREGVR